MQAAAVEEVSILVLVQAALVVEEMEQVVQHQLEMELHILEEVVEAILVQRHQDKVVLV
jgi:hypothetical protein